MNYRFNLLISCLLLMFWNINAQNLIIPNTANSISPSFKQDIILGGTISNNEYGQVIDIALGFSPAKNFGILLFERIASNKIALGGGLGMYKTVTFEESKTVSRKYDVYAGLHIAQIKEPTYNIKHNTYFLQFGLSEQYNKWGFSLISRFNIVDFTTLEIRRINDDLKKIMEEVEQDPLIYPDVNIKLFYGKEIKGFIELIKPFYKESFLINDKMIFALGAEINVGYVFKESIGRLKKSP